MPKPVTPWKHGAHHLTQRRQSKRPEMDPMFPWDEEGAKGDTRFPRHHKTCSCDPPVATRGLQERGLAMTEGETLLSCWVGISESTC